MRWAAETEEQLSEEGQRGKSKLWIWQCPTSPSLPDSSASDRQSTDLPWPPKPGVDGA